MTGTPATVLTLDPAFFPVMRVWLNKFATTAPHTCKKVGYLNIPSAGNAARGVAALDRALHETSGPKIVFGHSMGSQVAAKWLRERAASSDVDPDQVAFLLCGNPERKYGGALCVEDTPKYWGPVQASYGGPGIPDDTRYTVVDYARRGDFWADAPDPRSPFTMARPGDQKVHCNYFSVGLNDPDVVSYTEGNRTYKLQGGSLR